jgi:glycosyltransferase involved in cell wall biosynthesis
MRRKVLEAMAAGKTVVTTMLGAEGLYGSTAELPLVVEDEPLAMAQRIRLLLSEPASRRALGEKARAFVAEHHSWTAYADRQDAMYRELLKQ